MLEKIMHYAQEYKDGKIDFLTLESEVDALLSTSNSAKPVVSSSCEQPQNDNGDLVPLVWMIEKLRRREGGCTMNELVAEVKRNFKGIEHITHCTINYH